MRLKQIRSYMSTAIPVAPPLRCNVTGCLVCTELQRQSAGRRLATTRNISMPWDTATVS